VFLRYHVTWPIYIAPKWPLRGFDESVIFTTIRRCVRKLFEILMASYWERGHWLFNIIPPIWPLPLSLGQNMTKLLNYWILHFQNIKLCCEVSSINSFRWQIQKSMHTIDNDFSAPLPSLDANTQVPRHEEHCMLRLTKRLLRYLVNDKMVLVQAYQCDVLIEVKRSQIGCVFWQGLNSNDDVRSSFINALKYAAPY